MKMNFIDYQENILAEAVDREESVVYVFDNYQNLNKARKYYQKSFLEKESSFLTMADLKEKLFPTGKLILREEKLAALFYQLLTPGEKEELGIDNYFDVIEISAEFFRFYRELHEYKVMKLESLQDWQQEKYEIFQSIRKRYCGKMEELNYIDSTLAFDFKYFDDFFLEDYQGIVFVNLINFTPMEIELIEKLESNGYRLELYLQLNENDYDWEKLRISSFTFPEVLSTEIKLYNTEEDFLQVINLLEMVKREQDEEGEVCILDADFENSDYQGLLSSEKLKIDKDISFTESKIYKFLDILYNLLKSADLSNGELKLEIKTLLNSYYQNEFRDYYNLGIGELKSLYKLARDNYVYLSTDFIEVSGEILTGLIPIFDDINRINRFRKLEQFIEFLQELDLRKLDDSRFSNNISQYYDALLELYSLEEMGIVSSWNNYFPNMALGLFRLILNYLRYKKVKPIFNKRENNECVGNIKDLLSAPHLQEKNLFILNASHGVIPSENTNGFLLTEKQRADSGLKLAEMTRLEEKYYFFRHIFSSRKAVIFSLENMEENSSKSPFVEELILEYGLESKELEIKAEHYPLISRSIFSRNKKVFNTVLYPGTIENDRLFLEEGDFQKEFSLAFYKYGVLKSCYFKFFLEHIVCLEEEKIEINKELDPRFLGVLTHEFFEDVLRETGKELKVDTGTIERVVNQRLYSNYLRINSYYKKYYQDILFPKIEESILNFFQTITRRIKGKVKSIETEWQPDSVRVSYFYQNQFSSIYLNGRIDLLINTEKGQYLIDFKTGAGDIKQLDFYSLLLNPDLETECNIEKFIYSVLDEKYLKGKTGIEAALAEDIRVTLAEFFKAGEYIYEYKPSICDRCIMLDICRVVR